MKRLELSGHTFSYRITRTTNKHTYFHFDSDGTIEIRLGKYQTEHQALDHIRAKADRFASHIARVQLERVGHNTRTLFGVHYAIRTSDTPQWVIDDKNRIILRPRDAVDETGLLALEHERFEAAFDDLIAQYKHHDLVDISRVTYTIRPMTSRYGSCRKQTRCITLNRHLIRYPIEALRYVWLHEIAHLVHAHHGAAFYELLAQLCPDHLRIRQALKRGTF
jgi:predicted metal-dependent hydrolase